MLLLRRKAKSTAVPTNLTMGSRPQHADGVEVSLARRLGCVLSKTSKKTGAVFLFLGNEWDHYGLSQPKTSPRWQMQMTSPRCRSQMIGQSETQSPDPNPEFHQFPAGRGEGTEKYMLSLICDSSLFFSFLLLVRLGCCSIAPNHGVGEIIGIKT